MKVHTLIVDDKPGIRLFGMVHGDKFHRTAWKLNQWLPVPLERVEDLAITVGKEDAFFARFMAYDADHETELMLIKNRGTFGYLIQEFKQFDFVLMERNYDCDFMHDLEKIIANAGIEHIFPVQFENLRPQSRVNLEI